MKSISFADLDKEGMEIYLFIRACSLGYTQLKGADLLLDEEILVFPYNA